MLRLIDVLENTYARYEYYVSVPDHKSAHPKAHSYTSLYLELILKSINDRREGTKADETNEFGHICHLKIAHNASSNEQNAIAMP